MSEGLKQTFGGYFHNIWPELFGTWEGVVSNIIDDYNASTLGEDIKDLEKILSAGHSESALEKIVNRDLGANVNPPGMDMTYQDWLSKVLKMFQDGLKKKKAGGENPKPSFPILQSFLSQVYSYDVFDEETEKIVRWEDSFSTWQAAAEGFVKEKSKGEVVAVKNDLEKLIRADLGEEKLRPLIQWQLMANIYPPNFNMGFQEWLEALKEFMESVQSELA